MPTKKNSTKKISTHKKIITDRDGFIDLDETLFHDRKIFIHSGISTHGMEHAIKQLLVLDLINNKPVTVHLNSYGGEVHAGFAFIDTIKRIKSKVIVEVQGCVCSMGALIAIAGNERHCYKNTWYMFHDMSSGMIDYSGKMEARAEYLKRLYKKLEDHIKEHTKLTQKEIDYSRDKELWIHSDEAIAKGLADKIVG